MSSRIFRKSIAVFLIFILLFVNVSNAFAGAASDRFIDRNDFRNKQYESVLDFLTEKNILQGKPTGNSIKASINDDVTRSEFLTLIVRALILSEKINTEKVYKDSKLTSEYEQAKIKEKILGKVTLFKDKSLTNHWSEEYIKYAEAIGLISGYPNHTFKPNNAITFEEMSEIIAKASTDNTTSITPDLKEYVTDVNENSWSFPGIIKSIKTGIFDVFKNKPTQYGSKHNRLTAFLLVKSFFEKNTYFEEQTSEIPKSIITPTSIPSSIPTSTPIPTTSLQNSSSSSPQSHNTPNPTQTTTVSSIDHLNLSLEVASNNEIKLFWDKADGLHNYTLSQSKDNKSFDNIVKDIKENFCTNVKVENGSLYKFKLAALNTNGKVIESNEVLYAFDGNKMLLDSDGDLMPDDIEAKLNLSTSKSDTDNDGLEDFYEVTKTITDPLKKDSDGNGISDADEDLDSDGLKNLDEFKIGTNPKIDDTDTDGLKDGFEVDTFKTLALKADTDEDGLDDGAEFRLGANPNNPDSNKNGIKDSDEVYKQDLKDNKTNVLVEIEGKGDLLKNATVTDATYSVQTVCNNSAVVSSIYDIHVENQNFNKATVTIPVDKSRVPNEDLKNVAVFWYDENNNTYVKLENQKVDIENGIVSADTTHFSKFVLLYVPNWHAQFEFPINKPLRGTEQTKLFADVVLAIDSSGSMQDNDPYGYRKTAAINFVNALINGDKAAIVDLNSSASVTQTLTSDFDSVKGSISGINSNGGTSIYSALQLSLSLLKENSTDKNRIKYIILLTDGKDDPYISYSYYDSLIEDAANQNISIITIGLSNAVNSELLVKIAGGNQNYFPVQSASDLPNTFSRISEVTVEDKDTDDDGISDSVESRGIKDGLGNVFYTDPDNYDSDGDGISDGDEVGEIIQGQCGEFYIVKSNPNSDDSDSDGLPDELEYEYGTRIWQSDSDNDGLSDREELIQGFDPLQANADGDSFSDYEELKRDSDPYVYDKVLLEHLGNIVQGFFLGDCGEILAKYNLIKQDDVDSIGYVFGAIAAGFFVIGDIEDIIAGLVNGNLVQIGFASAGLIPGAGDAAKSVKKILGFVDKVKENSNKAIGLLRLLSDIKPLQGIFAKSSELQNLVSGIYNSSIKMSAKTIEKVSGLCSSIVQEAARKIDVVRDRIKDYIKISPKIATKIANGKGFESFKKLKEFLGSPGEGKQWHHIVEQCQIKRSGFSDEIVHNTENAIAVTGGKGSIHSKISGYYSSKPKWTNGKTIREWLSGKSFDEQFEFGLNYLKELGEVIPNPKGGWIFKEF